MTDRDALYRAILDNPEDDTLRLVYADALEESGDPQRADFIRTQVELSHLPEYDPLWVRARCQGHGRTYNPSWTAELDLPHGIDWAQAPFRRGLPGAVQVSDGAAFVPHADELFSRYPIESLELPTLSIPEARAFAGCSRIERLTSLSLTAGIGQHVVREVLASPHLSRLTELRVGSGLTTPETVSAILRSWVFNRLTSLGVRNDQRQGGPLAGGLARLSQPPRLKKLDLSGNRLTADTLAALVASEAVAAVDDLNLSDNNLGAAGGGGGSRGAHCRPLRAAPAPPRGRRRRGWTRWSARPSSPNCGASRSPGTISDRRRPSPWPTAPSRTCASSTCARPGSGTAARLHSRTVPVSPACSNSTWPSHTSVTRGPRRWPTRRTSAGCST
nr:TIGR02996 domain-containing protein [Frigoriglobus tundricola]